MAKNVLNKIEANYPVALVVIGWLAFVLGQTVDPISLRLVFLSASRVLPRAL